MKTLEKILISRCFLGEKVKYNGGDNLLASDVIARWQQQQRLVLVCPEVSGSLAVPRPPAEITPDGRVLTQQGEDVSEAFRKGAEHALSLCRQHHIRFALLKESSPSCGSSKVYDGSFSQTKRLGEGVTTALLRKNGVQVYSEQAMNELVLVVQKIDR